MAADTRLLQRFWTFLRPHRRWLWVSLALMPIATVCQLAGPLIIKDAIDAHLLGGDLARLGWDALAFLGVLVGEYAARAGERFTLIRCGVLALRDLRRGLMDHICAQPVALFERRPLGTLVSRITSDVEALMDTLTLGVVTIVSDALLLIGILAAMAWLHVRLTLVTLAASVPVWLIVDLYRKRLREDYARIRRHTGRMNACLNEAAAGLQELQLFHYQPVMQRRFGAANRDYYRDSMRVVGLDAALYSFVEGMGILTIAVMAWYGVRQVMAGAITIGVLVAFLTYIQRFYVPIKELSSKMAILQSGLAALERIVELLDHDERRPWGAARPDPEALSVHFDRVWFVYPQRPRVARIDAVAVPSSDEMHDSDLGPQRDASPDGAPGQINGRESPERSFVLTGLSLSVSAGERVAIVGWTGSGKSTIVKLLAGLYDPVRGRVLVGGRPVTDYDRTIFQRRVGVVHQDVRLLADSVAWNVGLGDPSISRRQIEEACRLVQADGFIRRLPRGYETILEPGGRNLSQGQRQLLAFARVLAWSPGLVVLDEATSNVDSHSERLIQAAILEVLRRKTAIVIAHRLSTIKQVDRIHVLHEGRVVEAGTHEDLLARRGSYRDLFDAQLNMPAPIARDR